MKEIQGEVVEAKQIDEDSDLVDHYKNDDAHGTQRRSLDLGC